MIIYKQLSQQSKRLLLISFQTFRKNRQRDRDVDTNSEIRNHSVIYIRVFWSVISFIPSWFIQQSVSSKRLGVRFVKRSV
jgi:hypothetical protein